MVPQYSHHTCVICAILLGKLLYFIQTLRHCETVTAVSQQGETAVTKVQVKYKTCFSLKH